MNSMKRIVRLTVFLMGCWGTVAQAAPFPNVDCPNAITAMEQSICNNSKLSALDSQLGERYRLLKKWLPPSEGDQLEQAQNAWLQKRNVMCLPDKVDCLLALYEARITELSKSIAVFIIAGSYPAFNKECEEAEIQQYAQDFVRFSRLASWELRACGSKAVPALIALIANETNRRLFVLISAPNALIAIGKDAKVGVPRLIELLESDQRGDVRQAAAYALGGIGEDANAVVPALRDALKKAFEAQEWQVCFSAVSALGKFGKEANIAVPLLIKLLESDASSDIRQAAVEALGQIGGNTNVAVPALIEAMQDRDGQVWYSAVIALEKFGKDANAKDLVSGLIDLLKNDNEDIREKAAFALALIGKDAELATQDLRRALKDNNPYVRSRAAVALSQINPDYTMSVVSELIAAIAAPEIGEIQSRAIAALGEIGGETREAVLPLIEIIEKTRITFIEKGGKESVRVKAAVMALGNIGSAAQEVVPTLIELLLNNSKRLWVIKLRGEVAQALGKIGANAEFAVPALITALGDQDQTVRRSAYRALEQFGVRLPTLITQLIASLDDPDESDRHRAALALGTIGQDAVPAIITALRDARQPVRQGAAYALGQLEVASGETLAQLAVIVQDQSNELEVRRVAASSLELLGQDMRSFFEKYHLTSPQNAICPPIDLGGLNQEDEYVFFEFDGYTGRCVYAYEKPHISGERMDVGELIDGLNCFFTGRCK